MCWQKAIALPGNCKQPIQIRAIIKTHVCGTKRRQYENGGSDAVCAHAIALHFLHNNFCRIHQTLRITPAMEAGISNHVWSIEEIVELLDRPVSVAA